MINSLPSWTADPSAFSTFVELLRWRACHEPYQCVYTFLHHGETEGAHLTYEELDRQARAIGSLLQSKDAVEKPVLLLYPPGLEYIAAFFGCLYAGSIAVPAYPPQSARLIPRIQAIVEDSGAAVVLTTADMRSGLQRWFAHVPLLRNLEWLATDDLAVHTEDRWQVPAIAGNTLAFLQYTSGSTGIPRGVMVSHNNLLHNVSLLQVNTAYTAESTVVSWLPTFHDMGLIGGVLHPVYVGCRAVLMAPAAFLQRPYRWLRTISCYKANVSGGPDFAYDLCARKITDEQRATLDLSSWNAAFSGSEPIHHRTLERFTAAFKQCGFRWETFLPCYGLAEATLMVSCRPKGVAPVIKAVDKAKLEQNLVVGALAECDVVQTAVGCGSAELGQKVIIVDPETLVQCRQDQVGEIWVSGPSVAQGYWNRAEETTQTFHAYLPNTGEGPFLRTGDLGFLLHGELFVTGRLKDLIVIRGSNHYPQDIELSVEQSHSAIRSSCCVAFSITVESQERLVIVAEIDPHYLPDKGQTELQQDAEAHRKYLDEQEVIAAVRQAVSEQHDLQVYQVALLKAGGIPKTSSGKLQRRACRASYLENKLAVWNA